MPVETPNQTAQPVTPADELWRELHTRLHSFIRARISDPESADDVAQEVLLRLHRSLDTLRAEDRLDAFAYRIARNAIIDHYRARAVAREAPEAPAKLVARAEAEDGGDHEEGAAREELARCLAPLIRRLPEPYREALTLTDLGKLTQAEAAQVTGLSGPGMKARVQRARAQVHELLTGCCAVALDGRNGISQVERTGPCACSTD